MIATDMPGCREVVCDGVTGLLVKARDVGTLASAMERLGMDGELRDRLRRAARDKAEAVFSVDDVVRQTFEVYEELVSS
jgi:glycosyltransferase involved in cell wall biosynthesis